MKIRYAVTVENVSLRPAEACNSWRKALKYCIYHKLSHFWSPYRCHAIVISHTVVTTDQWYDGFAVNQVWSIVLSMTYLCVDRSPETATHTCRSEFTVWVWDEIWEVGALVPRQYGVCISSKENYCNLPLKYMHVDACWLYIQYR